MTKKEVKYIFEGEADIQMLKAIKKLLGQMNNNAKIKYGLTEEEAELCSLFYSEVE